MTTIDLCEKTPEFFLHSEIKKTNSRIEGLKKKHIGDYSKLVDYILKLAEDVRELKEKT